MRTEHIQLTKPDTRGGERGKAVSEKLSTVIVYAALAIIAVLAVPMCLFLGAIMLVWSLADKIIQKLEPHTRQSYKP